jgi:RHS repeat-associated protein
MKPFCNFYINTTFFENLTCEFCSKNARRYLVYGKEFINQRSTTFDAQYKFSGKERDIETGYGYFGARYYSSELGIWISTDPMADERPSYTPYNFCRNNPIILTDPSGLLDEDGNGIPPNFKGCLINDNKSDNLGMNQSTLTPASNNSQATQTTNDIISTVGTAISTSSTTAGVVGEIAEGSDATFRLTNGKGKFDPKLYSNGWKGNQHITPNSISKIGKGIKFGGSILSFASAGISFSQISSENSTLENVEHGVDGGMSIVGTINVYTFAASMYYSAVIKNYPAIQQSVNQQSNERANMMQNGFIPVGHPGFPFK